MPRWPRNLGRHGDGERRAGPCPDQNSAYRRGLIPGIVPSRAAASAKGAIAASIWALNRPISPSRWPIGCGGVGPRVAQTKPAAALDGGRITVFSRFNASAVSKESTSVGTGFLNCF